MLRILTPWDEQPQDAVDVDWANPDTRSLVGVWPLSDGSFRDATGRNNGTPNAGVTPSVSIFGRTFAFNGTSGAVTLPTPPAGTTLTATNSSVSFWVYPTNLTGFRVLFHQWNGSNGPILYCNGTSLIWQIGPSGGGITAVAGIELNKWQHFVCTFSGANALAIYKNGALLQSGTPGGISNIAHTIAAQWGGTTTYGWYTAGQMAAPAMWTRGLSADEARRQYEASWQLFTPRSIWVPVSAGGGSVTGTSATTNANDTSAASGTTTVVGTSATTNAADTSAASGSVGGAVTGTSATTNANDTSSASGTTTVTGTVGYSNANDSATASGWAGAVSGTAAVTNANDAAQASGTVEGGATDTHDGFWSREWHRLKKREEKKPTLAEVAEIVKESPQVLEVVRAEVVRKYPQVDYASVRENVQLQRFIAKQLIEAAEEEDDIEAMLLLA